MVCPRFGPVRRSARSFGQSGLASPRCFSLRLRVYWARALTGRQAVIVLLSCSKTHRQTLASSFAHWDPFASACSWAESIERCHRAGALKQLAGLAFASSMKDRAQGSSWQSSGGSASRTEPDSSASLASGARQSFHLAIWRLGECCRHWFL